MQDDIHVSLMATRQVMEDMLADSQLHSRLRQAVEHCVLGLNAGKKLMFVGNGGSAAEAQHLSAEMVGRFLKERRALPSIALNTDTSALTAIGNDYGYDQVFARQVEALGQPGDILISMSTSGRSKNVVAAMQVARQIGLINIALTGIHPRDMGELADVLLKVPSSHTPQIQEGHLVLGHLLCGMVENQLLN
jgi:D-sedoheptulose 7-phosphate isomerase